ncbi:MAG TPA: glycosyl hydrolase [Terriglobia bacterium]|nr:glycosyl hydrolase [Terriglobia bacterium]
MNPVLWLALTATAFSWLNQPSGSVASLRGVCAVSAGVVWASGSGGTCLRTKDGGTTWGALTVPGAAKLDFRGVVAFDDQTAFLMSAGPGAQSQVYRTSDGGAHWDRVLSDPDPDGFFDALAFWDRKHGMVLGDPVAGRFVILTTEDGGARWQRQSPPPALKGEGAFAASNSSLVLRRDGDRREAWFGTGGPGAARVFHSADAGRTWSVAATPLRNDSASAGIFSLAFADSKLGVAVGGDYSKPEEDQRNVAVTSDGGRTWVEPAGARPHGFRSAVTFAGDQKIWITTGTSGSDLSTDGGKTWAEFDSSAFNAIGGISGSATWAVGPKGRIARLAIR